MRAPLNTSASLSNAPEPDYGDISSQQLEVSTLSDRVYANDQIESELIKMIKQLNDLISRNQDEINRINRQIGSR